MDTQGAGKVAGKAGRTLVGATAAGHATVPAPVPAPVPATVPGPGRALVRAPGHAPVPAVRRPAPRPKPELHQALAHLDLDELRALRSALSAEESKVSYWRRILQARLDVVRAGTRAGGALDGTTLRPILTDARVGAGRQALVEVLQTDDLPPLPSLAELWDRRVAPTDAAGQARLVTDLSEAEQQLSAYRRDLHARQADATGELIARYRQAPTLCLSALPLGALTTRRGPA